MMTTSLIVITKESRNLFIPILLFTVVIDVIFLPLRITSYIDEVAVLLLAIYGLGQIEFYKHRDVIITFSLLLFYLLYSLLFGINVNEAVFLDFIIFSKPFICFYVFKDVPFTLTYKQFYFFHNCSLLCVLICILELPFIDDLYGNTTFYYSCCLISALFYLLFSKFERKDLFISIIILSCALISDRAKYYSEYLFFIVLFIFVYDKITFNIKFVFVTGFLVLVCVFFNWSKFSLYVLSSEDDEVVRHLFYTNIGNVVKIQFPFGPGFGSYNTEGAAKFYSPLYQQFGFSYLWGASPESYKTGHDFLHDTFYPSLAQFGLFGFLGYLIFWIKILMQLADLEFNRYRLVLFLFVVVLIENIASNGFTSEYGIFFMMMLGYCLNKNIVLDA